MSTTPSDPDHGPDQRIIGLDHALLATSKMRMISAQTRERADQVTTEMIGHPGITQQMRELLLGLADRSDVLATETETVCQTALAAQAQEQQRTRDREVGEHSDEQ